MSEFYRTKGFTQEQLSQEVGLSKYQIRRAENGLGDTTLENLHILSQYYEVPLEEILKKRERFPIQLELRRETKELIGKDSIVRKFSKIYSGSAGIRMIQIPSLSKRKLKIVRGEFQDLLVLKGRLRVQVPGYIEPVSEMEILSCEGEGWIELVNASKQEALIIVFSYSKPVQL